MTKGWTCCNDMHGLSSALQIALDLQSGREVNSIVCCCFQVFIVSSKKIQDRNYETLFKWITKQKGNIIARVVLSVPPPWQVRAHDPLSRH